MSNKNEFKPKRKAYDSVFTKLFSDPKNQLLLYKELHPEDVDVKEEDIENVTLESVLMNSVYNDLGFTVKEKAVFLVEAQSTWCANMPLRTFIYLAETYKNYIVKTSQNYYSSKAVRIPKPEIYMVYTGDDPHKEEMLSMADTFFGGDNSVVDVKVKVLYGDEGDTILSQYVRFTNIFKKNAAIYGRTQEAVLKTVAECMQQGVLTNFFEETIEEVIDMVMALFDKELNYKMLVNSIRAEGQVEGLTEGRAEGLAEGLAEGRAEGRAEGLAEGLAEGRAEGRAEGLTEGRAEGLAEGLASGRDEKEAEAVSSAIREGLPKETIMRIFNITSEKYSKYLSML